LAGVIQYRPLDWILCIPVGVRLVAGRLTLDQSAYILGSGATAAHHALDVVIEVRILAPQPHIKAIIAKALPDLGVKRAFDAEGSFYYCSYLEYGKYVAVLQ
jgi:hypothetical protein